MAKELMALGNCKALCVETEAKVSFGERVLGLVRSGTHVETEWEKEEM